VVEGSVGSVVEMDMHLANGKIAGGGIHPPEEYVANGRYPSSCRTFFLYLLSDYA